MFDPEIEDLDDGLKTIDREKKTAPEERLTKPEYARNIFNKFVKEDENSAFNRNLVQQQKDFVAPLDGQELEDKGQGDTFNVNTGTGPVTVNESVSSFMDIFTTPRSIAEIPLKETIDESVRGTYEQALGEEFTVMLRNDARSYTSFLQLADIYSTHGVAIPYYDDRQDFRYNVTGLDDMKFPRKAGLHFDEIEIASCLRKMTVTELYKKVFPDAVDGWDQDTVISAILSATSAHEEDWDRWEEVQKEIKANEIYVDNICDPVELVYTYVQEFDGGISFYITTRHQPESMQGQDEKFLFRKRNFFKNANEAMHIFAFGVGNGGRLYTVRGMGYITYQLANALDILYSKLFDNARTQSSLIMQPRDVESMQDATMVDFGGGLALPPNVDLPQRPPAANLNQSLIPAIDAARGILDIATGGLASGHMLLGQKDDRQTKIEWSSKLDYINKLNGFAVVLFYVAYDPLIREQVTRVFTKRQKDPKAKKMVAEMMERLDARGIPKEVLKEIDYKRVRAHRIIGTGSRSSRILLFDQLQQMYPTFDDDGKENFSYDFLVELIGAEKASRYKSRPQDRTDPIDTAIADLENYQLEEGDYIEPKSGENRMVHLKKHLERLENNIAGVEEGQVDIIDYTIENIETWKHATNTLELTTVHESLVPELNMIRQRLQQIGEIITNGTRALNARVRKEKEDAERNLGEGEEAPQESEDARKTREHNQKLQIEAEEHLTKLEMMKEWNATKIALAIQDGMSKIASRDAEVAAKLQRAKAQQL